LTQLSSGGNLKIGFYRKSTETEVGSRPKNSPPSYSNCSIYKKTMAQHNMKKKASLPKGARQRSQKRIDQASLKAKGTRKGAMLKVILAAR